MRWRSHVTRMGKEGKYVEGLKSERDGRRQLLRRSRRLAHINKRHSKV
jgi:hypothetical protein